MSTSDPTLFRTEAIKKLAQTVDSLKNNTILTAPLTSPLIIRDEFIELKRALAKYGRLPELSHTFEAETDTKIDKSELQDINYNTDMSYMFSGCSNVQTLDVSNWTFTFVLKAKDMFLNCSSLTSLDVSKWNTELLSDARQMFKGCSSLTSLDVSKWNTVSLEQAGDMFADCTTLSELDVSKWNTKNLDSTQYMFQNCSSLTHLDMSSWDLSNAERTRHMFEGCTSLTELIMNGATIKVLASDNDKDYSSIIYSGASSLDDNTIYKLTGSLNEYYFGVSSIEPVLSN